MDQKLGKSCISQRRKKYGWKRSTRTRTEKDKKDVSHVEKFVTEGNEKADELAKEGAMEDEGFVAQVRARFSSSEKKSTQRCSTQPAFTVWWRNGKTVKNSCRSREKSVPLRTRKEEKPGIERSGVLLPASTAV